MTGTPIDLVVVGFIVCIAPTLIIGGIAAIAAWRK